jgi:hypothetical protein
MTALRGSLSWPQDSEWTYVRAALRGTLTPFGSRAELFASAELRDPPPLAENESLASPAPAALLRWPVASSCGDAPEQALTLASGEALLALSQHVVELAQMPVPARWIGSDAAETELTVELDAPTEVCGYGMLPTRGRLHSSDGRLDVAPDLNIDPEWGAFFFNTRYNTHYTYPPAVFAERVGQVDADLTSFAHVGVEVWFEQGEVTKGELKVIGWAAGDCSLCEGDACFECSWDNRVVVLDMAIGEPQ